MRTLHFDHMESKREHMVATRHSHPNRTQRTGDEIRVDLEEEFAPLLQHLLLVRAADHVQLLAMGESTDKKAVSAAVDIQH